MSGGGFTKERELLLRMDRELEIVTERYTKMLQDFPEGDLKRLDAVYRRKKTDTKKKLGYATCKKAPETAGEPGRALVRHLEAYKEALIRTYQSRLDALWHMSAHGGLKEIRASEHCRDAYLNEVVTAVFASSDYPGNLLFLARAAAGRVLVAGEKNCIFPYSPVGADETLVKPASVYRLAAAGFEPCVDFGWDARTGQYGFRFSREWILRGNAAVREESVLTALPEDFFRFYRAFACGSREDWARVCAYCMENAAAGADRVLRELADRNWIYRIWPGRRSGEKVEKEFTL